MSTVFKKGQVVYCALRGKGVVKYITGTQRETEYPVMVAFDGKNVPDTSYTKDGRVMTMYPRTLFFSPPMIIGDTEPPFEPTLNGKYVVVQMEGGEQRQYIGNIEREDFQSFALTNRHGENFIIYKSRVKGIFELSQIEFQKED